ncbi:MAG: FAD-dependent oxidoreductase [Bacilli bacterium]|nr:FAD-dependent oxidoreductase [Bacilli bacterium]
MNELYDCLIIGSGPCGISASIELKNAGKKVAILEYSTPGGKVNIAPRVDNYPGFKEIPGPQLAVEFYMRANNNHIEFIYDFVNELTKVGDEFILKGNDGEYRAKTVLIASGTKEKKIGVPKEDEFLGHGVSYCALCDGHFFKDKTVVVIGGGNAALKEALHLVHIASKLYLVHRRNEFRGYNKLVDELKEFPNAEILTPYVLDEILGENKVEGVILKNRETEEKITVKTDGLFPLVGQLPNTQFVKIEGVLDEYNTIPVGKGMETPCAGLYAGGDVTSRPIRQIYLAERDGKTAAKSIIDFLK